MVDNDGIVRYFAEDYDLIFCGQDFALRQSPIRRNQRFHNALFLQGGRRYILVAERSH